MKLCYTGFYQKDAPRHHRRWLNLYLQVFPLHFSNNPIFHTCLVSVSNHWSLTSNTYKLKKNQGVNLIKDWLKEGCTNNDTPFQVPLKLQDYFSKSSKKDDLADCFLQGLWYLENGK